LFAHVLSLPHFHSRSIGLTRAARCGSQMNPISNSAARSAVLSAVCLLALGERCVEIYPRQPFPARSGSVG